MSLTSAKNLLNQSFRLAQMNRLSQKIRQNGSFDEKWYLERNPDIAAIPKFNKNPILHYLMHGRAEGRKPPPGFNQFESNTKKNNIDSNSNESTSADDNLIIQSPVDPKFRYNNIQCVGPEELPDGKYESCCEWAARFDIKTDAPKKRKSIAGRNSYTIVSAVYGVASYLDDFFFSMVNQTLNFQRNIHLIMVDDGSIDGSAEIIQEWKKKYPENITYLKKDNGGQASARNFGLAHVQTPWVTFIDPDDFIAPDYFEHIDNFLSKQPGDQRPVMIACKMVFWRESSNQFSDTHTLRYNFGKENTVKKVSELDKNFQLSVPSALFQSNEIRSQKLFMDERIRPNFEDAHFIGRYLNSSNGSVAFLSKPRYIYRKRAAEDSSVDTSWEKVGKYSDVLEYGYLDLLKRTTPTFGLAPRYIRRMVLYDLIWHIKHLLNCPEKISFLSQAQKNHYFNLLKNIFYYIDPETILEFELGNIWLMHKAGILYAFKQMKTPFQIVYIERYDHEKNQVLIRYFHGEKTLEDFRFDGISYPPQYEKTSVHDFAGECFINERWIWLKIPNDAQKLAVWLDSNEAKISIAGRQVGQSLTISELKNSFGESAKAMPMDDPNGKIWLFMDRVNQADDNAEHLYRYIMKVRPDLPIRFVLSQSSPDWDRLSAEGFRLFAHLGQKHREAMLDRAHIISSHADQAVLDPFGDGQAKNRRFIFLQHGVIKDDLSRWLNPKPRIDLFVTSSAAEYSSIAGSGNRYKFTPKEVVLTGLPRHDALIKSNKNSQKCLLIVPTWRHYLATAAQMSSYENFADIESTEYGENWLGFLRSEGVRNLVEEQGYRVLFWPHPNMAPLLKHVNLPKWIELGTENHNSMQDAFKDASILLTDYSSVAFDIAYLNKPVLYWQFDEASFFSGNHTYQKGYFDYREHGFGPVCETQEQVFSEISHLIASQERPDVQYRERMAQAFAWRDGKCCERVLDAILSLDHPDEGVDLSVLRQHAEHAKALGQHELAWRRWQFLAKHADEVGHLALVQEAQDKIAELEAKLASTHPWLLDVGSSQTSSEV